MARTVLLLTLLIGCGRLGFDATPSSDDGGDGGVDAPLPEGRWRDVSISERTSCAITLTGELWCGGQAVSGQLGIGIRSGLAPMTRVGTNTDWTAVALAPEHSCGLRADSTLWCWGTNSNGQIGAGVQGQTFAVPEHVSPGALWTTVASNVRHTCAIRADATLFCWGENKDGQLGIGNVTLQTRPTQVGTASWMRVAVGQDHTCGIQADSSLWCWGTNFAGHLGLGSTGGNVLTPMLVSAAAWTELALGMHHTCAIRADATVWCWGDNDLGQVGAGDLGDHDTPVQVLADVAQLAAGEVHTCATTRAGAFGCWGAGSRGRIPGRDVDAVRSPMMAVAPRITKLAAGGATTCVIDDAAHMLCTGASSYGQHGVIVGEVHTPERADTRTNWTSIAADRNHACGLLTDRSVRCWGLGVSGQLGDGARVDRQQPIGVPGVVAESVVVGPHSTGTLDGTATTVWGLHLMTATSYATPFATGLTSAQLSMADGHACRLDDDLTIDCIGNNNRGQIGNGTQAYASTPFTHIGTWQAVDASAQISCATDTARRLKCWGEGSRTGTGNTSDVLTPTNVINIPLVVSQVTLGGDFGCARTGGGELWCWGANLFGQLGDGSYLDRLGAVRVGTRSDWVHVDAGDVHACAIAADRSLWCWGHGDQGQLGRGDPLSIGQEVPMQVGTDLDWLDVACGSHFTCAIKMDGTRWCFGVNSFGELGNGRSWVSDFVVTP